MMAGKGWMLRLFLAGILTVGGLALTGCETWRGMGKDVEKTGEGMQGK